MKTNRSQSNDTPARVTPEEVLNAALLLREDDADWSRGIAGRARGRALARGRRNLALVAALTLMLGTAGSIGILFGSGADLYDSEDPYVTLYDTLYADTSGYPEWDVE